MQTYLLLRLTDDSGEDGLRAVFTGNTGLATAGTIVNDDSGFGNTRHIV